MCSQLKDTGVQATDEGRTKDPAQPSRNGRQQTGRCGEKQKARTQLQGVFMDGHSVWAVGQAFGVRRKVEFQSDI